MIRFLLCTPLVLAASGVDFATLSLLALIQGLTEFLPISSSGHLVLSQSALGVEEPLSVDIALHLGTLLAVGIVYRRDIAALILDVLAGRPRELLLLFVGSLPAAVVGIGLRPILADVFQRPRLAILGLFVTAAVLLAGELARRVAQRRPGTATRQDPGFLDALLIGIAQAFAIWPGISRSGATIATGLMRGLSAERAARFSFLLSIPAILGAAVLNLPDALRSEDGPGGGVLLWAIFFAGFVGWGALRALLAFIQRGAFSWFAVYCIALGLGGLFFA